LDVDRFAAELPGLWADFPSSPVPRGKRFDDVIAGIPNLAEENVLALLNFAASLMAPGESYVEVGSLFGASLIGASRGNTGDFVGIDNFEFPGTETKGRKIPPASREALEESLRRFGAENATIVEGDAFAVLESGGLDERIVGVYYFDGPHDEDSQVRGLQAIEPHLAEEALLVVDDHDWEQVTRATLRYLESQPNARMLFEIGGAPKGQPQWWEGVAVLGYSANTTG
jgi:predicted O-methyltransferase YrrM